LKNVANKIKVCLGNCKRKLLLGSASFCIATIKETAKKSFGLGLMVMASGWRSEGWGFKSQQG